MSAPTIDFLRPPAPPRAGWVLLALGATALVAALAVQRHWAAQEAQWQAQQEARQAATERARRRAELPAVSPQEQKRQAHLIDALSRPWLPTLKAVEDASQDPVYLLGLSIDPESGKVQLDGDAPSFDHALSYVQRLDLDRALEPGQLVSHETVNDPTTSRSFVRFTAVTRWRRS
jgi:hypothetical protein